MRSVFDFSSWQAVISTVAGLVLVTVIAVGIRLVVMQRVQQRRERQNRQINERLKTLIAAYKTLGGSFTGALLVDPAHRRDARAAFEAAGFAGAAAAPGDAPEARVSPDSSDSPGSERRRRIRDAVEAALSDVILLGTAEQVRLAAQAAQDMAAGRRIETAALVVSLRDFIRQVLDLQPIPKDVIVPSQGPSRGGGGARAAATSGSARGGGSGGRAAGAAGGAGLATGGLLGAGRGPTGADDPPPPAAVP